MISQLSFKVNFSYEVNTQGRAIYCMGNAILLLNLLCHLLITQLLAKTRRKDFKQMSLKFNLLQFVASTDKQILLELGGQCVHH